jgi:hypothetical protein
MWRPNGEAQPPTDEYGGVRRHNVRHKIGFQKRRDSAPRLERNLGRLCSTG